ncbi:cytochrome b5-like heme/steroid binding domain-containing protein [Entophlyctis helioformis]|nr:cytochrome b5-like heme/steroid binding domain-containing protein [Entophlyctis helioformis]
MSFASDVVSSLISNPLNWALAAVLAVTLHSALFPDKIQVAPPQHPNVIELRRFTPKTLAQYDGRDGRPIYMGVNGKVYDVSRSPGFYGPGSAYENFSGRDASRGLAKHSFDASMLVDINGPIDTLADLTGEERQALAEWADFFAGKYDHVGMLVENTSTSSSPVKTRF